MTIERYSHVMHITCNVTGQLADGRDAFDALRVCLPAGTVSGAPKVRAMQIIDELEPHRRGPYAGAVGYVDFTGNMDTCIALRTIVVQGEQGLRPGRRRHRRRQRARRRISGNAQQGPRPAQGDRNHRRAISPRRVGRVVCYAVRHGALPFLLALRSTFDVQRSSVPAFLALRDRCDDDNVTFRNQH